MTIELDKAYPLLAISINFGKPDIATWGILEISLDGAKWHQVNYRVENERINVNLGKAPAKYIRFTNSSDKEQEVYMRQFNINILK